MPVLEPERAPAPVPDRAPAPVPEPAPELERALFNSRRLSRAGLIAKGKAQAAFWAAQAEAVAADAAVATRVVVDPLTLRDSSICPQDGDPVNPACGDEFTACWSDEPSIYSMPGPGMEYMESYGRVEQRRRRLTRATKIHGNVSQGPLITSLLCIQLAGCAFGMHE